VVFKGYWLFTLLRNGAATDQQGHAGNVALLLKINWMLPQG